jgi:hypothetical protein
MSARLQAASPGVHIVIDDVHDLARASDGFSRFGAYLAMRLPAVIDDDPDVLTDPVRWAAFAWATATTPVMSPGYLDWNGPIEDIQVCWDEGQLLVEAVLRTSPPVDLPGWRGWERDRQGNLVEPRYSNRVALAQVALRALLDDVRLPRPPREPHCREEVVATAKTAISSVAQAVEDLLAPAVAALADPGRPLRLQGIGR